jgi:hypothetical protein
MYRRSFERLCGLGLSACVKRGVWVVTFCFIRVMAQDGQGVGCGVTPKRLQICCTGSDVKGC